MSMRSIRCSIAKVKIEIFEVGKFAESEKSLQVSEEPIVVCVSATQL